MVEKSDAAYFLIEAAVDTQIWLSEKMFIVWYWDEVAARRIAADSAARILCWVRELTENRPISWTVELGRNTENAVFPWLSAEPSVKTTSGSQIAGSDGACGGHTGRVGNRSARSTSGGGIEERRVRKCSSIASCSATERLVL